MSGDQRSRATPPRTILIAALGGEGGGVLVDWLVDAARRAGLAVQATSVPGVAQRTGSTSYYLEFLLEPAPAGQRPVFALMPVPGRVDVLLASELLEAVRMAERGFVVPDRTLLITARHRVLTTAEKMMPGDGRFDSERLHAALTRVAARYVPLDLQGLASRHGTAISAVLYGALAGSGVLPWGRELDAEVIRASGVGVDASLAGYDEAWKLARAVAEAASGAAADANQAEPTQRAASAAGATAADRERDVVADRRRHDAHDDEAVADSAVDPSASAVPIGGLEAIVELGAARATDYQDEAYAALYRERVARLAASLPPGEPDARAQDALQEAARRLALWMCYEDVARVADLKTRRSRFEQVRREALVEPGDVLRITEHLSPGVDEIAAILPVRLGRALHGLRRRRAPVGARERGLRLTTTSMHGFALLRLLAQAARWRRHSLRHAQEQQAIERWLAALAGVLPLHAGYARALASLPRLRRGYSDTFERGLANYERLFDAHVEGVTAPDDSQAMALAEGIRLAADELPTAAVPAPSGGSPPPPASQPIRWISRAREKATDESG